MATRQLIEYIRGQLKSAITKEDLRRTLVASGWREGDVDEAYFAADEEQKEPPKPPEEKSSELRENINIVESGIFKNPFRLLKEAFEYYKKRAFTLIGISLVPFVIAFAFIAIGAIAILLLSFLSAGAGIFIAGSIFALVVAFIITLLIFGIWAQAALFMGIVASDENIGIRESFRRARGKILSMYWVMILSIFIFIGGFVLLIIPALIFATWFSFSIFLFFAEGTRGLDALLKSKEYVRGRFWGVLGRIVFMFTLFMMVVYAPLIVFGFETEERGLLFSGVISSPLVGSILTNIFSFILGPLFSLYYFVLYRNLKALKGEFVYFASRRARVNFSLVGALGVVAPLIVVAGLMFSFAGVFPDWFNSLKEKKGSEETIKMPALFNARNRGFDAQRKAGIVNITIALESYYIENSFYPESLDQLVPGHSTSVPTDPVTGTPYDYSRVNNGAGYWVCATLAGGQEYCKDK